MNYLEEKYVEFLRSDLEERGLTYAPLQEEILDHVCCAVEFEMANGQQFSQAYASVVATFGDEGFQKIQTETIYLLNKKKRKFMKVGVMMFCLLFFGVTGTQTGFFDPPSIYPIDGIEKVTSGFGMRLHPVTKAKKLHKGVDFVCPMDTPIKATSDGIVEKVVFSTTGYGNHIVIRHDDEFQTKYAHLSKIEVIEGDEVSIGDVIAFSGNSGASSKPHLHYEVLKNGKAVDPADYFVE